MKFRSFRRKNQTTISARLLATTLITFMDQMNRDTERLKASQAAFNGAIKGFVLGLI